MSGFMTALFLPLRFVKQGFHSITPIISNTALAKPEWFSFTSVRTNIRCHFPRPNEVKRIRRHGWKARISTPSGRRIIMRRLLKGRFVLSH